MKAPISIMNHILNGFRFHECFSSGVQIAGFFFHIFWQKFREINFSLINYIDSIISRNMWVGKKTFLFFIHCDGAIVDILKDYSPKIFANVFTGKMISFFFFFNKKMKIEFQCMEKWNINPHQKNISSNQIRWIL